MDPTTEYLSDTMGGGGGAFEGEPVSIARRAASRVRGTPPARILGTSQPTSTDLAAFANTVLVRYLDCNDTYVGRGTGHPSDMIPGVLAMADAHRANGRAVIEVTATGGRRLVAETSHPKGHHRNPLTDGEVEAKFRGLASGALGPKGCNAATLDGLFESLVISR